MNPIDSTEAADLKKGLPRLTAGDTVRVHVRVKESTVKEEIKGKPKETERERVQVFEGIVIGLRGAGARATMTVRKVSFGQGVERIFPLHAKTIEKIEVVKQAQVRRAKLYYLRGLKGKAAGSRRSGWTPPFAGPRRLSRLASKGEWRLDGFRPGLREWGMAAAKTRKSERGSDPWSTGVSSCAAAPSSRKRCVRRASSFPPGSTRSAAEPSAGRWWRER